jgi:predicted permease
MTIFGWRRRQTQLDAEIRSHLEMAASDHAAHGDSAMDAAAAARREFGNVSLVKETTREMWGWTALEQLTRDTRYAFRALRKSRGFALAAIATLGLGIGGSTTIFSVADHVALRPLPYTDARRLFVVHEIIQEMIGVYPRLPANASHFLEWQRNCGVCDGLTAFRTINLTLTGASDPEQIAAARVSASVFPLLGVHAGLGRLFTDDDDQVGHEHVVVLSDAFWRRAFGADSTVLGRTMTLNNSTSLVVGILPRDFSFPGTEALGAGPGAVSAPDLFVPLALTSHEKTTPGEFNYTVIGRLAAGATLAQARARFDALQAGISERIGQADQKMTLRAALVPLQEEVVGSSGRALLLLVAAVGAMLLIVCVNLTNLLLARYAGRLRESAVRVALGARRGRLVRQALTESLVLAACGGAFGILLSRWGLAALLRFAPADLPRLHEIRLDGRVLAVAIALSLITGLIFGIVPAFRFGRVDPGDVLKGGGRTTTGGQRAHRTREFLIASQVGLSALLLSATGLFLTSFVHVLHVDKGFTVERVLALDIGLPANGFGNTERRVAFFDEALQRLSGTRGVQSAAMTNTLPLEGEMQVDMLSRENDTRPEVQRPTANIRYVSPGYFATLGIPLRRGRSFAESDRGRPVVVLSERAARALWPNEDPIGKRMIPGSNDPLADVVGIVPDVRTSGLEHEASLIAYIPYWQNSPPTATLLVSTVADPVAVATTARAAIRATAPAVPVSRIRTMGQIMSSAVAQRRFQLLLLLLFAATALATASIGIYGIISHSLAQRRNELGIRMALGARPADVHRLVLMEGLTPATIGLVAGMILSVALGRAFSALLFEVRPGDPLTLAGVAALLTLVAALACYLPARRATRPGPALALRLD